MDFSQKKVAFKLASCYFIRKKFSDTHRNFSSTHAYSII